MKRFVKVIALIACAAMLCAALCSCQMLDEAKKSTAYFTDNTKTALTFNGNTYRRIETPKGVSFILNDTKDNYHAASPDIPVLLAGSYGKTMLVQQKDADDPRMVAVITSEYYDYYSSDYSDGYYKDKLQYYLKEDAYDEVKSLIENAECDHYCTYVYRYDYAVNEAPSGNILLNDDQTAAVNRTLSEAKKVKWSDLSIRDDWESISLVSCDESMLVTDNKRVHIVTNGYDFYLYEDSGDNLHEALYSISDDDCKAISQLYQICQYSMEYEDIESRIEAEENLER